MKKILTTAAIAFSLIASAQWSNKTIESKFDGTFKKCINNSLSEASGFIMMEQGENLNFPMLAIRGSYFCDDKTTIDIVFETPTGDKRHTVNVFKSSDNTIYFFEDEVWSEEFKKDFKAATYLNLRVNQETCTDDYYRFNFSGSTSAFNFISK